MSYYFDTRKTLTDLTVRDETNYLLDFINIAIIDLDKYGSKDIRHNYFELMYNVITNYSFNAKNFFLRVFREYEKNRTFDDLYYVTEDEFKGAFDSIVFRYRSIKTHLDRSLIVEVWSMFEFSINTIFEYLFTDNHQFLKQEKYAKEFKSILKKYFPNQDANISLAAGEIARKMDSFVPTMDKVNKIFKKSGIQYEQKVNDIMFLEFYGRLRNGIHNNFIYKGPNKPNFEFNGNVYKFQDGEHIIESVQSMFDIIELSGEFLEVALRFFKCLNIDDPILNPAPTMDDLF